MTTTRKTNKVAITVCLKIKDLAEQIYDLNIDEILCLFKEVDDLFMVNEDGFEWNEGLQEWIDKRNRKKQKVSDASTNKNDGFPWMSSPRIKKKAQLGLLNN
tara:strand:+ start:476 stop:781 length:306 start_codon:yes stop_codon:yes gene_type:complete